jgi:hypothetical protein
MYLKNYKVQIFSANNIAAQAINMLDMGVFDAIFDDFSF